jgi:hypothetical protein
LKPIFTIYHKNIKMCRTDKSFLVQKVLQDYLQMVV